MAGYYDKNKDYSKELQRTDLTSSERAQLTQERQNKIDAQYGGKEPNMTGSNKTYSQTYGGGSKSSSSKGSYNGIDYTRESNGGGLYGVPTSNSEQKNYTRGGVTYRTGPDMSRRQDLAGGYAVSNGYTVFYDNNGYAYKVSKGTADYTPHQDINAGNGTYGSSGAWTDNEMLSEADKAKITAIRARLNRGEITGDQANQAANAIRAGYGYSIDKNGYVTDNGALSAVNDLRQKLGLSTDVEDASTAYYRYLMNTDTSPQAAGQVQSYDEFSGSYTPTDILQGLVSSGYNTSDAGKPSFDYSYDTEMRALIDQILNSNLADWKQGDQYAALKDQYAANGEMSMSDLLGQVSSRTGGLASSYATSVANQEYNDWMSKLEQAAQEMYQQDRSDKLNNLGVLNDAYSREYGEYTDQLNQWNTDRSFAYQQAQDALSNDWKQKEWDYNLSQDEWNKAAQQAETMAAYGDFSGYQALGYTDSQINQMRQAYQIAQAAKAQSGTTQSSGSGGSSGMKLSVAKDNAKQGIFSQEVLDAFHNAGYSDEYLESAYGYERPSSAGNNGIPSFGDLKRTITTLVTQGKGDRAYQLYSQYFDSLSTKQQEELNSLLGG